MFNFKKNIKINKNNVFDYINNEIKDKEYVVSNKVAKILKKATNSKRKKDSNKNKKNNNNNIIEVQKVSKYYLSGNTVTKVLNEVDLEIKKGEFIIIYGKSGSGKSTLLNLISGLDRPSHGDVIVCDNNLPYLSDNQLTLFRRKHVSFIFQNYNLLENLTGYDNVETGLYLQKNKEKQKDINELFKQYEIYEVKDKYPAQMSGGQQQRISILRALAKNAELIFADEPTGALDENTTRIVLSNLYDINKNEGTTIVMVSHNPSMMPIADRIIRVENGKITSDKRNVNKIHPSELKQL